ncbi:DUF6417 family protein [Streptomyces sp. NPDC023723]|uniref:DUF6417 family protein n=1 Tax=Streptomyces sp. NPDC023723 TaxID=3154323 RepID=UPI0033E38E47
MAPAAGLAEKVRSAGFDRTANRWQLPLTDAQLASAACAFHLRAMTGSVAEAGQPVRPRPRRLLRHRPRNRPLGSHTPAPPRSEH